MSHSVLRTVMHDPLSRWPAYFAALIVALISVVVPQFAWALIGVAALVVIIVEIARRAETLVFYDDGVERVYQMVSTNKEFIEFDDVQEVKMEQSLFERMFNLGTLNMQTAGEDSAEIVFEGIRNPHDVEQFVRDCLASVNRSVRGGDIDEDIKEDIADAVAKITQSTQPVQPAPAQPAQPAAPAPSSSTGLPPAQS